MNFGVSAIIAVLPILIMQQSFAKMTRATPDQLQNLPGFGQVKVKNIKNSFEKPFHNQTTSSIAVSLSQKKPSGSKTPPVPRPARPVSPEWGIEGDDAPLPVQDEVEVVDQGPLNNQLFDVDLDLTWMKQTPSAASKMSHFQYVTYCKLPGIHYPMCKLSLEL